MKTAVQELIEVIEMDYNNGVQVSMRVFHKMLLGAKAKEREQMINFHIEVLKAGLIEEGVYVWENEYLPLITSKAIEIYNETFSTNDNHVTD